MASTSSQEIATFDDYITNFRSELNNVAKTCLAGLEFKITEEGDGWLDAHLEAVFSSSSSAPFVQHLKTPSKTATVKKTRAKLEAEKQRTDKIKNVNAKLALSPSRSMNGSPARLLFQPNQSPLQPRSMNATSPSPMKSRLGTNKPATIEIVSKGNKGKGKQADGENAAPAPAPIRKAVKPSVESGSPASRSTRAALSPVRPVRPVQASPTRPTKSPLRQALASPTPKSPQTRSSRPQSPLKASNASSSASNSRPSSRAAPSPVQPNQKDLSMIAEGPSERSSPGSSRQAIRSPIRTRPLSPRLAAQQAARSPRSPARKESAPQPSIDAMLRPAPAPVPASAPVIIAPAPTPAPPPVAAPIKSVRSSWLSKALGSGGVPVNVNRTSDATSTFRKSVVPQARPTLHDDYAGLRKSLAPPNGLKRKSDQGIEEQEPAQRPEKIIKIDNPVVAVPTAPSFERKTSHPSAPTPAQAEIQKVTKALEEIKESNHAKELAKQKAAALANGRAQEAPIGTGLIRNLTKSLGFGGKETPEEEAARLARELEDDRQAEAEAQAELDRLMNGNVDEVKGKEVKPVASAAKRSTTPVVSPPARVSAPVEVEVHPTSDKTEEEEDAEEERMVEDISFVEEEEELEVIAAVEEMPKPQPKPVAPVPTLAPRLQTPPKLASIRMSTTPIVSPPAHLKALRQASSASTQVRSPKNTAAQTRPESSAPKAKAAEIVKVVHTVKKEEVIVVDDDTEDEADDDDEPMRTGMESVTQHVKHVQKGKQPADVGASFNSGNGTDRQAVPRIPKSSSSVSLATTSNGLLNQASTIAAKTLGVKPTAAPVKAVQLAQAAARKEQEAAANRKLNFREQAEAKRLEALRKKAAEEKAERLHEVEKARIMKADVEKKRAERDQHVAQNLKIQEERMKKSAEEEANRKRKMAPTLTKTTIAHPAKKPQPTGAAREPFRPTSSMKGAIPQASTSQAPSTNAKLGPTTFRTAAPIPMQTPQAQQSTVKLVTANPANLGPPSRPSGMTGTHPHPQWSHIPTGSSGPSNVLQQQRVALQTQLDDKALNTQSEDIVLPDINSEYSDSDDSEKSTDFKRPDWAESPELRAALERQSTRNPDELFGPIKPISMEELFKVKISKFRPRSSSANWASGDGVTKREEVEYAKRMGFRNTGARGEGSSGSGL